MGKVKASKIRDLFMGFLFLRYKKKYLSSY